MDENNYKYNPETGEPIIRETVNEQPAADAPKYQAPQQPQYQAPQQPQYQAPQQPQYQAPQQPQYQAPQQPQYQAPQQPQYQAPQQPQYQAPQQQAYNAAPQAPSNPSSGKGIAGLVLSICSIVFCWLGFYFCIPGLIPLAMAIVGIIIPKNIAPYDKPAKICGIIGLVLTIIWMIVGIFMIVGFANIGSYAYGWAF
ncbi:MAG: hypothetical protein ACLVKR_07815 [Lachnospiraceae bacterium]